MWWAPLFLLLVPALSHAQVVMTEVMCAPSEGSEYEYVKIKNLGAEIVDISKWKFNDGANHGIYNDKNGAHGDLKLDTQEEAFLAKNPSFKTTTLDIYYVALALADNGDSLSLINESDAVTNVFTYGKATKGSVCLAYSENSDGSASTTVDTLEKNTITTYNEVTKWRTVEIQPPQDIYIRDIPQTYTVVGTEVPFTVEVFDSRGAAIQPHCSVTFGDGTATNVCTAVHVYRHAGEYVVSVRASHNQLTDTTEARVIVTEPDMSIGVVPDETAVIIYNSAPDSIRLSGWDILVSRHRFSLPEGTTINAQGKLYIDTDILGIDLHKYGPIVTLVNALGREVASGGFWQEETDVVMEATSSVLAATPSLGVEILAATPLGVVPAADLVTIHPDDAEIIEPSVEIEQVNNQLASAITGVETVQFPLLPKNASWMLGVIAIIGLGVIPLFAKLAVAKEGDSAHTMPPEAETFTIKELT